MNIDYNCVTCDYTGLLRWLLPVMLIVFLLLLITIVIISTKRNEGKAQ